MMMKTATAFRGETCSLCENSAVGSCILCATRLCSQHSWSVEMRARRKRLFQTAATVSVERLVCPECLLHLINEE